MTTNNLDYYNFLHQCAKNSSSVQWLWSTPDKIIVTKLTQKFPRLDPKILQKFCKNLSYIKKEKNKKNSEKNPLAIIYYLKNKKDISKIKPYNTGECHINQRKSTEVLINYPLCLKTNSLLETKQHEICHAKFEYISEHYPTLNNISIEKITRDKKYESKIYERLDEIFRDELLAYITSEKKFIILLDHEVRRYLNENYINSIYQTIRQAKMKNKKKYFNLYYKIYLKQLKLKPLYYYLVFHEFNRLKNKYPKNYLDKFFNLLAPLNCLQFIAQADKKTIKKYKVEKEKFISYFNKKACLKYKNDPDYKKIKKVYQELLSPQNIVNLHFYNSPRLLKSLLLIFSTYLMDEENTNNETFFNHLFNLIIQSYHYKQLKCRRHYNPLILKLIQIKKNYLPSDQMHFLEYLEHIEKMIKNSYI